METDIITVTGTAIDGKVCRAAFNVWQWVAMDERTDGKVCIYLRDGAPSICCDGPFDEILAQITKVRSDG